jgi:hypothetical protein
MRRVKGANETRSVTCYMVMAGGEHSGGEGELNGENG